ncbi:MAG: M3 family oligoendopeptidase [Chitinophagales bacterium]|nr:M3 family oligoendopeptidase [Chitinophagales bacterium]
MQSISSIELPTRKARTYISENFDPGNWEQIEPYMHELLQRPLNSLTELEQWLKDQSELDAAISEYSRWAYVRTTVDTTDEKSKSALVHLYGQIAPQLAPLDQQLKQKLIDCPYTAQLDANLYGITIRGIKNSIALYREKNVPLISELQIKQSGFDALTGAQSIQHNGTELTLLQAALLLKDNDRQLRENIYVAMAERRAKDADALDTLLTELIQLRHQIALNAGFKNYVEYRFAELGRFDYTKADCEVFHQSVQEVVVPLLDKFAEQRKAELGVEQLFPWDVDVDTSGKPALQPSSSSHDLIEKTIACFNQLDPYFGERIEIMRQMNYLDLETRLNKGAGGYNMTMPEIGVPFIFMNSANGEHDLITIVHEGGHAIHTFLAHQLPLNAFKDAPSEIAEVASMAMELMTMQHWDIYYGNADDAQRAKENHLKYILNVLAKTCLGDSFQYWLYENPNHTVQERRAKWTELYSKFTAKTYDWSTQQLSLETGYQRILHFYIVPLYYIEYAFAELGALAIWKNYRTNPKKAVEDYKKALSLGYTKPIPEFYKTAGAEFNFSKTYVQQLVSFVETELNK